MVWPDSDFEHIVGTDGVAVRHVLHQPDHAHRIDARLARGQRHAWRR